MQPRVVVTFFNDAHTFHAFHAFSTLFRCPKRSINDAHLEIYPRHYEISTISTHPRVPIASVSTLDGRATRRPQTNACARASSFASRPPGRTNERTNGRTIDRLSVFAVARREVSRRLVARVARGDPRTDARSNFLPRRIALSRSAIARSRSFAGVLAIARRARGRDRA